MASILPTAPKPLPSADILRQILNYDPETGLLQWKARTPDLVPNKRARNVFNAKFAGKPVQSVPNERGHFNIEIFAEQYRLHRVIWVLHHGVEPVGLIDHEDGNGGNNRIVNLRDTGCAENAQNAKLRTDNKSGHPGVAYRRRGGKWVAYIGSGKHWRHLGTFATVDEAIACRQMAQREAGYHANHGRRAA